MKEYEVVLSLFFFTKNKKNAKELLEKILIKSEYVGQYKINEVKKAK